MQAITIKLTTNKFPNLAKRLPQVVNEICETSAKAIEADVKVGMAGPHTGRVYSVGGVDHQASAPGEMPAIDTGALASSIQTEADGPNVWVVYTGMDYAQSLEFGSVTQGILPRPYFVPATERERPNFIRALQDVEDRLT